MATKRQLLEKIQAIHDKHNNEVDSLRGEIYKLEAENSAIQHQLKVLQSAHRNDLRQVSNLSSAYDIQQERIKELEAENASLSEKMEFFKKNAQDLRGVIFDINVKRAEDRRLVKEQDLEINEKALAYCVQLVTRVTTLPELNALHANIVGLLRGEAATDKEGDLMGRVPVTETSHESRTEPHVFGNGGSF